MGLRLVTRSLIFNSSFDWFLIYGGTLDEWQHYTVGTWNRWNLCGRRPWLLREVARVRSTLMPPVWQWATSWFSALSHSIRLAVGPILGVAVTAVVSVYVWGKTRRVSWLITFCVLEEEKMFPPTQYNWTKLFKNSSTSNIPMQYWISEGFFSLKIRFCLIIFWKFFMCLFLLSVSVSWLIDCPETETITTPWVLTFEAIVLLTNSALLYASYSFKGKFHIRKYRENQLSYKLICLSQCSVTVQCHSAVCMMSNLESINEFNAYNTPSITAANFQIN